MERTRRATPEVINPLTEKGNLLCRAKPGTINRVVQNSVVRHFEKGDVVFEQGERSDNLPLFCIISGRFSVTHVWGGSQRHVVIDGKGALIGDVELLLRGEPLDRIESAIHGLDADQTWAKVQCASRGEVLSIWPADFLLQDDQSVALALAKSMARKLMLRSAVADPKTILPKPKQVELYLKRLAKDLAESLPETEGTLEISMSLSEIAAEVECAKQTVAVTLKTLTEKHPGFSHRRSLIVVPRRFADEPLELYENKAG
jgi:CRP-like cAMP-binding protein